MAATVGAEGGIEDLLANLIRLEHDAVAAYEAAVDRLHEAELRSALSAFNEDHLRHIRALSGLLSGLGRPPPRAGDTKQILTRGKIVIGGLIGDSAVLHAMRSNEDDTNAAYERAVGMDDLPGDARRVIEHAREDERRHRDWIAAKLREM